MNKDWKKICIISRKPSEQNVNWHSIKTALCISTKVAFFSFLFCSFFCFFGNLGECFRKFCGIFITSTRDDRLIWMLWCWTGPGRWWLMYVCVCVGSQPWHRPKACSAYFYPFRHQCLLKLYGKRVFFYEQHVNCNESAFFLGAGAYGCFGIGQ